MFLKPSPNTSTTTNTSLHSESSNTLFTVTLLPQTLLTKDTGTPRFPLPDMLITVISRRVHLTPGMPANPRRGSTMSIQALFCQSPILSTTSVTISTSILQKLRVISKTHSKKPLALFPSLPHYHLLRDCPIPLSFPNTFNKAKLYFLGSIKHSLDQPASGNPQGWCKPLPLMAMTVILKRSRGIWLFNWNGMGIGIVLGGNAAVNRLFGSCFGVESVRGLYL